MGSWWLRTTPTRTRLDNGSNGSGDGDEISPQNPLCLRCEWASGAWDARHVVNGNAVYELPFGRGKQMLKQDVASAIAGNWQLTTTALARTGFPVNVLLPGSAISPYGNSGTLRPNRVPGSFSDGRRGGKNHRSLDKSSGLRHPRARHLWQRPARSFWSGRVPGRSTPVFPRPCSLASARAWSFARSSTTSSTIRNWDSRRLPSASLALEALSTQST